MSVPVISKEEKEAIVRLGYFGWSEKAILSLHFPIGRLVAQDAIKHVEVIKQMDFDILAASLYRGYEVMKTPEEQLVELYHTRSGDPVHDQLVNSGILEAINTLGIKIPGINVNKTIKGEN